MKLALALLHLTLAFLAGACASAAPHPASGPQPEPPVSVAPTLLPPLPTLPPTVDPPPPFPTGEPLPTDDRATAPVGALSARASYTLTAQLDYAQQKLAVSQVVVFTNPHPEPLADLLFAVEANRYPGFSLASLAWEPGGAVQGYDLSRNRLRLPFPEPLQPGERALVHLEYTLQLPAIPPPSETERPQPYGYTSRQTNLVDWYPYLPPYRPGQGWQLRDPWYYGEHQVYDVADYFVELWVTPAIPGLVVAASAPAQGEGDPYRYRMENARSFALSLSPVYQVFTTTVGGVSISSYAFPFASEAGEAALRHTAEALELYSRLFGPYPHPSLSVVAADFLDGMEYDGLFFLSRGFYNLYDGTPQGYLTAIAVHETAHQWWYGVVGSDQALEPWLDEALCTYAERLYYEHFYPELLDWWWSFRIDLYQPVGWVDLPIYEYGGFLPYRNAVYLRGAQFLEELRNLLGDEAFFAFLREYAARFAQRQATSQDFFDLLRQFTTRDLGELSARYFKNPYP